MVERPAQTTVRERQKADRRAQLLATAATLFAERGFASVSMEELGASAGVTGPALYKHFRSKQDLLGEVLVGISRRLRDGGRTVAAGCDSAPGALGALVEYHVAFALGQPELIRVQERDMAHLSTEDRTSVRRLQRSYVELWVAVLRRVREDMPVEEARVRVHATFGLLNSTPHSSGLDPDRAGGLYRRMALAALTS